MMGVEILQNENLKKHCTWRIGGNAEFFAKARSINDIKTLLKFDKNATILGNGSNVLINDNGIKGLTIKLELDEIKEYTRFVEVEAGVKLPYLASYYYKSGYGNLTFASGIPATVGGAIKSNAGAHGSSIGENIVWVEVLRDGKVVRLDNSECGFGYRISGFQKKDIVLKAAIKKIKQDKSDILEKTQNFMQYRRATQPGGFSAGSVFKAALLPCNAQFFTNIVRADVPILPKHETASGRMSPSAPTSTSTSPPNIKHNNSSFLIPHSSLNSPIPAGLLIDKCGLKGTRIGGTIISQKHANFILNIDNASSKDVLDLIDLIKEKVYNNFGLTLNEEIIKLGEF